MKLTLVSASLSKNSRSRQMLSVMQKLFEERGAEISTIDLREIEMDFCDARKESYGKDIEEAKALMNSADGLIFGYGVYCYSIPGVLKNFIDIACESMVKPFGQVIASGGNNAFLSHEHLSQILVNEVHAAPYPHVIFASYAEYVGGDITDENLMQRMVEYADGYLDWSSRLCR